MPESTFNLGTTMQLHVAGISLGLLGVGAGPDGPTVRLGAYNPDVGAPESHRLRPGDELTVAGRLVRVEEIGRDTVRLCVRWTEDQVER